MTWFQSKGSVHHQGHLFRKTQIESGFKIHQDQNNSSSYYNLNPLHLKNKERVLRFRERCLGKETEFIGLSSETWAYGRIEIDQRHGLLYCPLLKAGSTFWRRVFFAVRSGRTINTPYDISIGEALGGKPPTLGQSFPENSSARQLFLNDALKVMFVREPYSRLLSGYVDKLFSPNPYFWNLVGKYIIGKFRKNPSAHSLKCGHDVTFQEFVKYVIFTEEHNDTHRDAHFTPTYDQCKPCEIDYNVIGKMETFKEDAAYIFSNMGYNISKNTLRTWAKTAEEDAVADSTKSPFSWWKWIVKCMSLEEAGKRVWRKMQIRGILGKNIKYPFKRQNLKAMPATKFIKTVLKFSGASNKAELKTQKAEALMEAFGQVPKEDVEKLKNLFRPDFDLFGYEAEPGYLFQETSSVPFSPWIFDLKTL
ncbi:carbohydrate sulfotransferase 8-like isoform X2 [Gigantopelta aegis]|nr:carbohydrate sulfotransferase 8-like isoform X2 [Gigantopelta aegis]